MTLILTNSEITSLLDISEVIAAVEQGHLDLAEGRSVQPERHLLQAGGADTLFVPMIAATSRFCSVKLLADTPANLDRGLPVQQSAIMLVDGRTGVCEAFLHGAAITRFRTAAASAVATKYLARAEGGTLGLIGAGALAHAHLAAICAVRNIKQVLVWSRTPESADRFAAKAETHSGLVVDVIDDVEHVVRSSDILCTLTRSPEPIVFGRWFEPGLHVNAVGAPPRMAHREIDAEAISRARVVVDDYSTARIESGEIAAAVASGVTGIDHVRDELGDVISGRAMGRVSDQQITLYKSIGIGIQDVVTAQLVVDRARKAGVGTELDLSS